MKYDNIDEYTNFLFDQNFYDDRSEEEDEELEDKAHELIKTYGWPKVFEAWNKYLQEKCITPEAVINFANLFWWYGGQDYPIPEPHKFLGYMLYKLNCKTYEYEDGDIIESLAIDILSKAGYREANLYFNPYYSIDKDKKLLAAAEYWKRQNEETKKK